MRKIFILSLALSLTIGAAATTPTTADTVTVIPTSPTSPYTTYTTYTPFDATHPLGAPIYFFFHLGTANLLNPSQLINLDEVARIAKQYDLRLKVIGAADSATGTESINTALSRSRADYIARELAQRGIPTGNITATHTGGIDDYTPDETNRHTRLLLFFNSPEHPQ